MPTAEALNLSHQIKDYDGSLLRTLDKKLDTTKELSAISLSSQLKPRSYIATFLRYKGSFQHEETDEIY